MNLNKAFIIGNLTRDPELRTLPSGQPVTSFGVATNRIWKNPSGEKQQAVEYHNIVMFGKLAEIAQQYLHKGSMLFVEGRIQTRSWQAQDGTKRNRTEIIAERMQLGPKGASPQNRPAGTSDNPSEEAAPASRGEPRSEPEREKIETVEYPRDDEEINPDEIPF
ncbi:single-stranded DNA-binding protein [Patescibacteria group bacterium]